MREEAGAGWAGSRPSLNHFCSIQRVVAERAVPRTPHSGPMTSLRYGKTRWRPVRVLPFGVVRTRVAPGRTGQSDDRHARRVNEVGVGAGPAPTGTSGCDPALPHLRRRLGDLPADRPMPGRPWGDPPAHRPTPGPSGGRSAARIALRAPRSDPLLGEPTRVARRRRCAPPGMAHPDRSADDPPRTCAGVRSGPLRVAPEEQHGLSRMAVAVTLVACTC